MEVRVLRGSRWYELQAGGNGVTARLGAKEARGKLRPEEHEPHIWLGGVGEPATQGEARDHQAAG